MKKSTLLLTDAAAAAKAAREIVEKAAAAAREMTADERTEFDSKAALARKLHEDAQAAKRDEAVLDEVGRIIDAAGLPDSAKADAEATVNGAGGTTVRQRVKSLGLQVVESTAFKAAMDPFRTADGSLHIGKGQRVHSDPIPVKALFTGESDTSAGAFVVADRTDIVELLGRRPLTIRDVISVRRTTSDVVEFVRQTSHTNNAAPVPEATTNEDIDGTTVTPAAGGLKPEGEWAFEVDRANVKTIAEMATATKRSLADVAALEGLINDELRADLAEEEENQIISGDGTGENLEGILTVSGTQAQAWDTDLFTTIRRGLTKVRTIGRAVPSGIALNPSDVETIDLAREDGATGAYLGAGPFALGPRTLWGVPIVETESVPAGTGILGDWRKAVLWDREQATVTMTDSHKDYFQRNLVAILGEQREAFAVTRPSAFVVADLTAV